MHTCFSFVHESLWWAEMCTHKNVQVSFLWSQRWSIDLAVASMWASEVHNSDVWNVKASFLWLRHPHKTLLGHTIDRFLPSTWASEVHDSNVWNVHPCFRWPKCPHKTLLGHTSIDCRHNDRSIDWLIDRLLPSVWASEVHNFDVGNVQACLYGLNVHTKHCRDNR